MAAPARAISALTLTSSFYHPRIAMSGWELLSSASAYAVAARPGGPHNLHIVLSGHVARPFRYPQYYPASKYPWMELLSDEHVRCAVGAAADGLQQQHSAAGLDVTAPLARRLFAHPTRDVAVGHIADEPQFIAALHAAGLALQPLDLLAEPAVEGAALRFEGHVLREPPGGGHGGGGGGGSAPPPVAPTRLVRHTAAGTLLARSDLQAFAVTPGGALEMGMCGGPVLRAADGACAGLIEGVVQGPPPGDEPSSAAGGGGGGGGGSPRARAARLLAGAAVIIDAPELRSFLRAVERQLLK